ncbi:MAG: methyltransferase domain-containing protein [Candidatus Thiodiazotropha sp.]|jgi:SAM-dependent methyltransferase
MTLDNGYVTSDYLKRVAERMRSFKQLTYDHMAINPGDTVLDVGCGPGVDTLPLAERVGERGKVIGIDCDEAMLGEARKAALDAGCQDRVEHRVGSALALPLADDSVAACRAERLLQVVSPDQAESILAEMIRVTRAGGRVVLADTDWASASIDFSDSVLERRLMAFFSQRMRPNGLAGRRLVGLCRDRGMGSVRLDVVAMVQQRLDETPFGNWLVDTALQEQVIDQTQGVLWLEELQAREREGRFYACVNLVIMSGCMTSK